MKKFLPYGIIISIVFLFFYKTILLGRIPFPGDLLLSTYAPWRHVSYFGYVAGAVPSKDQYFDVIRELYPWKTEVLRQLKEGSMPLWNPYSFSGSPLLANFQSQVFYPLGVIYFLLPQIYAWALLVILQPILGGIFMYLFATTIGISAGGAIIAAIAFNFSSFATVWMEFTTVWHTILWLPFLLYLVEKAIKSHRFSVSTTFLFIFALFSSLTGGHPQDFIYSFLFFSVYTLTRIGTLKEWPLKEKILRIMHYALLISISFLLAAPQLIPTIELFQNSARVTHDYKQILTMMLIQPWQLGIVIVQDFFGNPAVKTDFLNNTYVGKALSIGSAGFFLALFSFFTKKYSWHQKFFLGASIVILAFIVRSPLTAFLYRYPIPLLSTGSPTRILFLFSFSMALLSGFGYDVMSKTKNILWKPIIIMCFLLGILWIFAFLHPPFPGLFYTEGAFRTMKKAMLLSSIIIGSAIGISIIGTWKRVWFYGCIALVSLELMYAFLRFNPFVPKEFIFPDNPLLSYFQKQGGIERIWGYGTAQIEADFSTQYRLFSPDGTDPLNLRWYNEFVQSSRDGNLIKKFNRTTRSDAQIVPGYGERDLPENTTRLQVMDSLGVKYIIDRSENPKNAMTFANNRFKEIWHEKDWTVYENLKAAPRYFLTSSYKTYKNPEEFEQFFFSPLFTVQHTILLNAHDASTLPSLLEGNGRVTLLSYKPNTVTFETDTNTTQLLYLSDTYDHGWHAYLDGKNRIPVYKANYAFRAVVVPEGKHQIAFTYEPQSFVWGTRLFFTGAGFLLLYSFWTFYKHCIPPQKHSQK